MNFNKYFIAAMLAVGIIGTATAQDNRANSFKNQEENQVLEEGASSAADYQTKQMSALLGLNKDQVAKVRKINSDRAKEIERTKVECGDDLTGFNQYVDKVDFARDQELSNVLSPEQFAFYANNKSNKTWLGIDKFKFRPEGLAVKENKQEPKIKGKAGIESEKNQSIYQHNDKDQIADYFKNHRNITTMPEAKLPDYHNIPKNDATPENSDVSANAAAPLGSKTATAKSKKPAAGTSDNNNFSKGQTLAPAPNSDDFYDTGASAKASEPSNYGSHVDKFNNRSAGPAQENFFINKNAKAKFTENEIKIKPAKDVKYKITNKEIKLKEGKYKLKENDNEIKIKDGDEKIKSNGHETKIKSGDLKIKLKE
jgi:hypothetical protein